MKEIVKMYREKITNVYKETMKEIAKHSQLTIAQANKIAVKMHDAMDAIVYEREYDDGLDYDLMERCRMLALDAIDAKLPEAEKWRTR